MEEVKGELKENVSEKDIENRKSKLNKFLFGWVKDNYDKVFIAILVIAFIIRVWIFLKTMNQPLWWDEADYLSAAKRWGLGLHIADAWYYRRGFLFPLIGALFFGLGLGEIGMRFLIVLFSTGIVALSYFIISKMFNKKLALFTSVALTFSWIFLFFTGRLLTDIPATFFVLLALLFFWKGYVLKEGNKFLYLFALFLSFAVLVRMQSFMFIPPFLIYILIKEKSKVFKNKQLWITLGIFLLLLIPMFILYSIHYGNPITDIMSHDFGVGQKAAQEGSTRIFSTAIFNYFWSIDSGQQVGLPYMLSTIIFILLIIGIIYFFIELFIGFDKIFKNEILQNKLFVIVWILSLFLIMGYIGSVSYVEQRYIMAGLPFLFMIALSPLVLFSDLLVKHLHLSKKVVMGIILILITALMIPNMIVGNSLIIQQEGSYSQIRQVGELIKADSNPGDIVLSSSLPQINYYSQLSTYPYDIKNYSIHLGDSSISNYSDGELGFNQFIQNKKPKYLMASIFEGDPDWILQKGTINQGDNYILLPYFNSSMVYNSQGQIVSLDIKSEVDKGNGVTLKLFYPTTQDEMDGVFVYKVNYS